MTISKVKMLKARIKSIKTTLSSASEKQKQDHVGINLAQDFNKIIDEISESYPDLKSSLPNKITFNGPYKRFSKSDSNYIDLEINSEVLLSLIDLIDES